MADTQLKGAPGSLFVMPPHGAHEGVSLKPLGGIHSTVCFTVPWHGGRRMTIAIVGSWPEAWSVPGWSACCGIFFKTLGSTGPWRSCGGIPRISPRIASFARTLPFDRRGPRGGACDHEGTVRPRNKAFRSSGIDIEQVAQIARVLGVVRYGLKAPDKGVRHCAFIYSFLKGYARGYGHLAAWT